MKVDWLTCLIWAVLWSIGAAAMFFFIWLIAALVRAVWS